MVRPQHDTAFIAFPHGMCAYPSLHGGSEGRKSDVANQVAHRGHVTAGPGTPADEREGEGETKALPWNFPLSVCTI